MAPRPPLGREVTAKQGHGKSQAATIPCPRSGEMVRYIMSFAGRRRSHSSDSPWICKLTNGSMIVYGLLIWLLAVVFDPIFHKLFPSALTAKGQVDFVYYTLTILGIVLFFQSQEQQRRKDELEASATSEQHTIDNATTEILDITKEINDVGALPDLIRSAAAEQVKNYKFILGETCGCGSSAPGATATLKGLLSRCPTSWTCSSSARKRPRMRRAAQGQFFRSDGADFA